MNENPNTSELLMASTADIVGSFVSRNQIDADAVPDLIRSVHGALSVLGTTQEASAPPQEPAVPIRSSVKRDHVVCLECGAKMKMLRRHLNTEHGLSADEYREKWNLRDDHPLVAPDYADVRRDLAKKIGLGRDPHQKRGRHKKTS